MVGASRKSVGVEAFAIFVAIGTEDSEADCVVDEGASCSKSRAIGSTLGVGPLVAAVEATREVIVPLVGEAGSDAAALAVVAGKHIPTIRLGEDAVAIHEHPPVVVESGAEDVFLGVEDALVPITLPFEDREVVSEAVHREAPTLGYSETPEALVQLHVEGVGLIESDGRDLLVEGRHDGVEGLVVLGGAQAIE